MILHIIHLEQFLSCSENILKVKKLLNYSNLRLQ